MPVYNKAVSIFPSARSSMLCCITSKKSTVKRKIDCTKRPDITSAAIGIIKVSERSRLNDFSIAAKKLYCLVE